LRLLHRAPAGLTAGGRPAQPGRDRRKHRPYPRQADACTVIKETSDVERRLDPQV
jgi:hypothetical protein